MLTDILQNHIRFECDLMMVHKHLSCQVDVSKTRYSHYTGAFFFSFALNVIDILFFCIELSTSILESWLMSHFVAFSMSAKRILPWFPHSTRKFHRTSFSILISVYNQIKNLIYLMRSKYIDIGVGGTLLFIRTLINAWIQSANSKDWCLSIQLNIWDLR